MPYLYVFNPTLRASTLYFVCINPFFSRQFKVDKNKVQMCERRTVARALLFHHLLQTEPAFENFNFVGLKASSSDAF